MRVLASATKAQEPTYLTYVGVCGQTTRLGQGVSVMGEGVSFTEGVPKGANPLQLWANPSGVSVIESQYCLNREGCERVLHAQKGGFMFQAEWEKTKSARNLKRKSQTLSLKGGAAIGVFINHALKRGDLCP